MSIEYCLNGRDIRVAREQLNLSQYALADILDCDRSRIVHWEMGTRNPSKQVLRIVDWLLQGWRPPEWPRPDQRGGFENPWYSGKA